MYLYSQFLCASCAYVVKLYSPEPVFPKLPARRTLLPVIFEAST